MPNHSKPQRGRGTASRRHGPVVTALGFAGVAVLVVLSVLFVRVVTGQQPLPSPTPSAAATQGDDARTTKQGQVRIADGQQDVPTGPETAPESGSQAQDASASAATAPTTTAAYDPNRPTPTGPVTIGVAMVGDVLMHTEVTESGRRDDGTYAYDHLFEHVKDRVQQADLRILNQETNLVTADYGYGMVEPGPTFGTPQTLADAEIAAGFNLILKATNHTYDMGYAGLACELKYWREHFPNIPVIGVSDPDATEGDHSQDYVNNVYVYEKDGFRVAVLNHALFSNVDVSEADHQYMSYLTEEKIREDVAKAREAHADMIIACPHWGFEFETTPNEDELIFGQLYADEGVDVIFGGHPHILQPCVTLTGKDGHETVCYYSAGNYVAANAMYGSLLVGGLNEVRLVKEPDGSCRVDSAGMVPLAIHRGTGAGMTTYPLPDYTDEVAADSGLAPSYVADYVGGVMGEGFDRSTNIYTHNMA